ncbi:hypothetical protein TKK_0009574 [Trichogramma kaykai]
MLFESADELQQTVPIDAQDKWGDTPLLLALKPKTDRCNTIQPVRCNDTQTIRGLMAIVELFETRGYKLERNDALKLMGFFKRCEIIIEKLKNEDLFSICLAARSS